MSKLDRLATIAGIVEEWKREGGASASWHMRRVALVIDAPAEAPQVVIGFEEPPLPFA